MKFRVIALALILTMLACSAAAFDISSYIVEGTDRVLYGENGEALRSDLFYLIRMPGKAAGLTGQSGKRDLLVRSLAGTELFYRELGSIVEPLFCLSGLIGCAEDGQGGWLVCLELNGTAESGTKMMVCALEGNGAVRWATVFGQIYSWTGCALAPDGQGGAYLSIASCDNYKLQIVRHFDAKGHITWKKTAEADGLVWTAFDGVCGEDGHFVVWGTAVSERKEIYKVVCLQLDGEGKTSSVEAMDFSFCPDYGFFLRRSINDGQLYALPSMSYREEKHLKAFLIPVNELPETQAPSFTLQDVGPETY